MVCSILKSGDFFYRNKYRNINCFIPRSLKQYEVKEVMGSMDIEKIQCLAFTMSFPKTPEQKSDLLLNIRRYTHLNIRGQNIHGY
ncbi:hypothetical protein FHX64_000783 [Microbacter margulisiae]|uniref:Uncharacterized protein n=1 Tax=Microbacter margulisiae TaxID=1350067 RepID=A0A7W5H1E7_9PORP|nr:hypothetical protein [Microbacter margulisiae]